MPGKKKAVSLKKAVSPAKKQNSKGDKHPFETDSQIQNRYGGGRKQSGSDGGHQAGRGSNH